VRRSSPVGDALRQNIDAMAPLLTKEQGKPLAKAVGELKGGVAWLKYTAGLAIPVEVV
jgi:acyl-CoA reductase-like NAD-dependent aldehyde dehydrogenase